MIEQAPSALQVDQEIEVAPGTGFAPRDRAEDTDIGGTMAGSDPQDLVSPTVEDLLHAHTRSVPEALGKGTKKWPAPRFHVASTIPVQLIVPALDVDEGKLPFVFRAKVRPTSKG